METQSIRSLKMAKISEEKIETVGHIIIAGIDDMGEDLMLNILNRLPALSFAYAACVSRSWNSLCNRILSFPKLSSAVSFNSSLENAVREVLDKVLSGPIRPHFAIASVAPSFSLQKTHRLVAGKLGSGIPIITNVCEGIIGRDLLTDKFIEVQWEVTDEEDSEEEESDVVLPEQNVNTGIILTVGFLPGLKAHIVPLLFQDKGVQRPLVDEFVMDIKGYAAAVSDSESPAGILLFAVRNVDMKPVLQKMAFAFSLDTVIVGDGGATFIYRSDGINTTTRKPSPPVALVFARDKNKPLGIGETTFHLMSSPGLSPVGLTYKAVSVKSFTTWTSLTASRDTLHEQLDGMTILDDIYDELGDRIQYPTFYIGVTKRRKCSVGVEKVRRMQFLEFHEVTGGNEEYLFVNSIGIKTGDPFRFYVSSSKAAISSVQKTSDYLKQLKQDCEGRVDKSEVFGGIIFSCCGRGDSFFGQPGIDCSPFLENFPGVTFGGTYCAGEIGRANLSLYDEEDNAEGGLVSCFEHFYSTFYLVMSYSPPPPLC